jgi:predicted nucleic acid-binding protein
LVEIEIDHSLLPNSAMLDSSVLIPALGKKGRATDDPACAKLFDALVADRRQILVSTPTVAEILRRAPVSPLPRTRLVRVVSFDLAAAEVLGQRFPPSVLAKVRDDTGGPLHYIKYDAMIVACAVRHRAEVLVTTDAKQRKLANSVGLRCATPSEFAAKQLALKQIT